MKLFKKIALFIFAATGLVASPAEDSFLQEISSKVLSTIEHSNDVPEELKEGLQNRFSSLVETQVITETGSDQEVRPYFVTLQGIIEQVLSQELEKSVTSLTGVIHTPTPTTPLCTRGEISPELVDPSIQADPNRLYTVKARTTIVRDFLQKGGNLYVVYPASGISKRTEEQQQIYQNEMQKFPTHLHNCPLNCDAIDPEIIGAFYLFQNLEGKTYAFAIKMTQANSPQGHGSYNLWFGELKNSPASQRISTVWNEIKKFLHDNSLIYLMEQKGLI